MKGAKMKVKNFPARKLLRQLKVQGKDINSEKCQRLLEQARQTRTKKNRGDKATR